MESGLLDRIPWERNYYIKLEIPNRIKKAYGLKIIKCIKCGKPFLDEEEQIQYHVSHLSEVHDITELTEHPEREFFKENFLIDTKKSTATCRICYKRRHLKKIAYSQHGLYLLRNHFEIYHEKYFENYELIMKTEGGRQILDKYVIKGLEAACPKCNQKIDMTQSKTQPAPKVYQLLQHYYLERYKKKNVLYFPRRENQFFVLLVLFQ